MGGTPHWRRGRVEAQRLREEVTAAEGDKIEARTHGGGGGFATALVQSFLSAASPIALAMASNHDPPFEPPHDSPFGAPVHGLQLAQLQGPDVVAGVPVRATRYA